MLPDQISKVDEEKHSTSIVESSERISDPEGGGQVFDRGLRTWGTFIGGFFIFATTFGYNNAFGVFQDYYTRHGTASASDVSWIGSLQVFLIVIVGLVSGELLKAGYFRVTNTLGVVIYVVSLFMSSLADPNKYWQLLLSQGIGMGVGGGLTYVPALAVQSHHWRKHLAPVVGVIVSGSAFGGVIFPIMLNKLVNGSVGFAWGVRATAFLVLGLQLAALSMMSARPPPQNVDERSKMNIRAILCDIPFLLQAIGGLAIMWGVCYPTFYLQLYAIEHGVDPSIAFYVLVVLNASSIPGRVLASFLTKRYGAFNVYIPIGACCAVISFALFGVKSTGTIFTFAALFGIFAGGFLSLYPLTVTSLATNESEIGTRISIGYAFGAFGALTGNPIDGALLGTQYRWSNAVVFSSVAIVLGTLCSCIARPLVVKRRGTTIV